MSMTKTDVIHLLRHYNFTVHVPWTIKNKIKLRSFKSSEYINEKGDGPYRDYNYLSLFSDPIDLTTYMDPKRITVILQL